MAYVLFQLRIFLQRWDCPLSSAPSRGGLGCLSVMLTPPTCGRNIDSTSRHFRLDICLPSSLKRCSSFSLSLSLYACLLLTYSKSNVLMVGDRRPICPSFVNPLLLFSFLFSLLLSIFTSIFWCLRPSACQPLSVRFYIWPNVCVSVCVSWLFVCVCLCLCICVSVCLPVCLSVCLSDIILSPPIWRTKFQFL